MSSVFVREEKRPTAYKADARNGAALSTIHRGKKKERKKKGQKRRWRQLATLEHPAPPLAPYKARQSHTENRHETLDRAPKEKTRQARRGRRIVECAKRAAAIIEMRKDVPIKGKTGG
jgi:hypothetical protein